MFVCLQIPWVRIQTRQREVLNNKRILVAMDSWPAWCRYPLGHYVKTLGEKGTKATETEVRVLNRVRSIPLTKKIDWSTYYGSGVRVDRHNRRQTVKRLQ